MKLELLIVSGALTYLLFGALAVRAWTKVEPLDAFVSVIVMTAVLIFGIALMASPIVFAALLMDYYYPETIRGW